jgi:hypothetical protein
MYSRQTFNISTDTGTQGDTGPHFSGEILQMAWSPTTGDTGAGLYVALLPTDGNDTGGGLTILNDEDCLGASFIRVPTIPGVAIDGFDTGVDQYFPVAAAGDKLRIKVTPGGAAVAGRLRFWIKD